MVSLICKIILRVYYQQNSSNVSILLAWLRAAGKEVVLPFVARNTLLKIVIINLVLYMYNTQSIQMMHTTVRDRLTGRQNVFFTE
jgi:hypothetical protein